MGALRRLLRGAERAEDISLLSDSGFEFLVEYRDLGPLWYRELGMSDDSLVVSRSGIKSRDQSKFGRKDSSPAEYKPPPRLPRSITGTQRPPRKGVKVGQAA